MNYTVKGRSYIANDGYVFHSTITDIYTKRIALPNPSLFLLYEVIEESAVPVIEEENLDEMNSIDS